MADSNSNMIANAMKPFGLSLLSYYEGAHEAVLMVRRDDGFESAVPVKHFFRSEVDFGAIERSAIEQCYGHVLDVGSGTGVHSIILESKGFNVTAIDITSEAVDIMNRRGFRGGVQGDIFEYRGGPFDTIIMLGHGTGIVGDLFGLSRFLKHARNLAKPAGQLLLDSLDVSRSQEPADLAYHMKNREAGRYIGEIKMQFEFQGQAGPFCYWLHIDQGTLKEYARAAGWDCDIILGNENGEYLARLKMINI
jgi:SAM-dependent methyltransferase